MVQQNDVHHVASAAVVVGADGSVAADRAVVWAADVAVRRRRKLRIVHGLDLQAVRRMYGGYAGRVPMMIEGARDHGAAVAERAAQRARAAAPGVQVSTQVSDAGPAAALVEASAAAYLVALGAAGASGLAAHVGSILLSVSGHGEGAVVVVRTGVDCETVPQRGPVVVGVDGSAVSEAAIGKAFEEASERGADLVAVHVWSDLDLGRFAGESSISQPATDVREVERAMLAERLAGWQEKYPDVPVTRKVYWSDPVAVLKRFSESAQLLVVGSRGRGSFLGMLLGSVSNALVQHAFCPVMVVHPA